MDSTFWLKQVGFSELDSQKVALLRLVLQICIRGPPKRHPVFRLVSQDNPPKKDRPQLGERPKQIGVVLLVFLQSPAISSFCLVGSFFSISGNYRFFSHSKKLTDQRRCGSNKLSFRSSHPNGSVFLKGSPLFVAFKGNQQDANHSWGPQTKSDPYLC